MSHFLAIQHTYEGIELGLFDGQGLIQMVSENKRMASKNCVLLAQELLQANALSFENLSFFTANQGPGPFTTLRVVIASVNGLAFASEKPLIGVDGLEALLDEYADNNCPITIALLNAYSKDVYFGIDQQGIPERHKGYKNITTFLNNLKKTFQKQPLRFIGQGAGMYEEHIRAILGNQAIIPEELPEHCSIQQIGLMARNAWKNRECLVHQLLPLYLKSMTIKKKKPSRA